MISQQNIKVDNENYQISESTYSDIFGYGPFIDFTQTIYKNSNKIVIELKRFYAEDSRYACKTRAQLTTELLEEISQDYEVCLKIWGTLLEIPYDSDAYEIQNLLLNFIAKNAKLE